MRIITSIKVLLLIILLSGEITAQETSIQLPTNDNTSGFNVTKSNGTSVLKVDGSGRITGDGSGLSNVKPLINYSSNFNRQQITKNHGFYDNIGSVNINAPGSGICLVMASGFADWESIGWDLLIAGIVCDDDPNVSWSAENEYWDYCIIETDLNCPDSSDQFSSFSTHRSFPVHAGSHTFTLWANKHTSSALVTVDNIQLTVLFIPIGGTGTAMFSKESSGGESNSNIRSNRNSRRSPRLPSPEILKELSLKENYDSGSEYKALKEENEALKERLDKIEQILEGN